MTTDSTRLASQASNELIKTRRIKLSGAHVWKVFGRGAKTFLDSHPNPELSHLEAAGLIAAVRDASLSVHEGEIFIIMGLSGSGKSTLVRCLSRLVEPTSGQIMFEDMNLLQASERELIEFRRHKMGMVFQHFALLPHLSVIDNVAFPLSVQGVDRKTREMRAHEVIELVGLKGRENSFPRELSGGQQQRVGIARSLSIKPEIWFLDEPFSALDPLIRREMQSELLRIQSMLHKTIIFITHDFDEAIRLADRIAIMKEGEIIQIGTAEDLVICPATDYVAEFTREVVRWKVMSARSLMEPRADEHLVGTVTADAKIATFAADILAAGEPFGVVDDTGSLIGKIEPRVIIDLLGGDEGNR